MLKPSSGADAAPVSAEKREFPTAIRRTSMSAEYLSRRPDSIVSTIAVLRRARDLVFDEQRWCKGSFARTWFGIPVPPQSALARRFCAIGAIMRAGRELQLRTQDACLILQWQVRPVEGWNDDAEQNYTEVTAAFRAADWNDHPERKHAEVIAAFDAALAEAAA